MSLPPPPSLVTVHADPVGLFERTISSDEVLQLNYKGLLVAHDMTRKAMVTTIVNDKYNALVVLSQQRSGKFQWNCGGFAGQQSKTVRMDLIARAVEGATPNAMDMVIGIKRRIRELLFVQKYMGTGWLWHTEQDDGQPSAGTQKLAYTKLIYEMWVTMG